LAVKFFNLGIMPHSGVFRGLKASTLPLICNIYRLNSVHLYFYVIQSHTTYANFGIVKQVGTQAPSRRIDCLPWICHV